MAKKVTLDDIAAETKLSKFSVSRAIAGKSGISEETRRIVLEASERLGYVKKAAHTNQEKKYVLFVIPKIDAQDTNFWMKVILGVENELTLRGYSLHLKVLSDMEDCLVEKEIKEAAGVIFAGYKSLDYVDAIAAHNKANLIMTYPPYNMFPYDTMYFADREGAYCLCEKMIQMGHRKIAYYGSVERPSMRKRFMGVLEAAEDYGLKLAYVWDKKEYFEADGIYRELQVLKSKNELSSLIICSTDAYAQSLIFILNRLGLEVPKDISITGYNSDLEEPLPIPLTSVGFSKREYGKLAVHYLMEIIEHPEFPPKRISVVPKLCLGGTTKEITEQKENFQ